jgi:glucoamylase
LESFASGEGLFSEQIWEAADIPEKELFFGRPSGSAMPLVWAHAEYLKLLRSLRDGRVFDMPPQTVERYLANKTEPRCLIWCFNHKIRSLPVGKILRIVTKVPAVCHWSSDDWQTAHDSSTRDTGLGFQVVDLKTATLSDGKQVRFTFFWPDVDHWEGVDFMVRIGYLQ